MTNDPTVPQTTNRGRCGYCEGTGHLQQTDHLGRPAGIVLCPKCGATGVASAPAVPMPTDLAPAEEWRDAVLDAMVCWEMWPQPGETPKQALNRLVAWEQTVALDPAVSEAAAKMRRAALEAAAVLVREVHDDRIRRGQGGFTSHAMMECQDAIRRFAHG